MKKISLITIFDNTNFGTYLQTVALSILLKDKGYEVELVKYIRKSLWLSTRIMAVFKSTKNPLRIANRLRRIFLWYLMRQQDWNFVKQFVRLSKKYCTFEQLKKNPPQANIYMTGSDQVWNSFHNDGLDKSFYCDYAPNGMKRVAYSASIGMDDFQDFEKGTVCSLLQKYAYISVREMKAKNILNKLGFDNVEVTLDPTLMLPLEKWKILIPTNVVSINEKFLLVYSVEYKRQENIIKQVAMKVAKQKGLKIYAVAYGSCDMDFCDKIFNNATPQIFISLIRQAEFTVVSSFHGTAFSINFNKQFFTIAPERFSSRIDSILKICKLQNRKISGINEVLSEDEIDYFYVNKRLEKERMISESYIDKMLSC